MKSKTTRRNEAMARMNILSWEDWLKAKNPKGTPEDYAGYVSRKRQEIASLRARLR